MNRIGLDRIGRGFKPNWIEPVFLGEFEGAEPPQKDSGGGVGGRLPPPPSEAEGRLKRGVWGSFSPPETRQLPSRNTS